MPQASTNCFHSTCARRNTPKGAFELSIRTVPRDTLNISQQCDLGGQAALGAGTASGTLGWTALVANRRDIPMRWDGKAARAGKQTGMVASLQDLSNGFHVYLGYFRCGGLVVVAHADLECTGMLPGRSVVPQGVLDLERALGECTPRTCSLWEISSIWHGSLLVA